MWLEDECKVKGKPYYPWGASWDANRGCRNNNTHSCDMRWHDAWHCSGAAVLLLSIPMHQQQRISSKTDGTCTGKRQRVQSFKMVCDFFVALLLNKRESCFKWRQAKAPRKSLCVLKIFFPLFFTLTAAFKLLWPVREMTSLHRNNAEHTNRPAVKKDE